MTATDGMVARRIDVGGRAVEYLEVGSGPPVVFLHGDGDSARDWPKVMEALAPHPGRSR